MILSSKLRLHFNCLIFLIACSFTPGIGFGQSNLSNVPAKFTYQAVLRDSGGQLMPNQNIRIRLSLQRGPQMTNIYSETHQLVTNSNGLLTAIIGTGLPVFGLIDTVNWTLGNVFIKSEIDITGGTNYSFLGANELLSVPYALHSKSSDNLLSQKLTDLQDAHAGGTEFYNSLLIGKTQPYPFVQASFNTGVGFGVFDSLTYGFNNTALGYDALKFNRIGNNNVSLGFRALRENNEGAYNVAIGSYALEKNRVLQNGALGGPGFQNVAIGSWALQNATSHMNVAVGTDVLRNLTTGGQNTGMGEHAMKDLITGFGNIAIGYASMMQIGTNVSENTAIGNKAGERNKGSNNIFIGSGAGAWNLGSGNVLIGLNAGVDSIYRNQNNILLIENSGSLSPLIYGDFQNKSLRINNTLNVTSSIGIGVTNPVRPLHVNDVMKLEPRATAPSNPSKGDIYFDDVINKLRVFDGVMWQNCW